MKNGPVVGPLNKDPNKVDVIILKIDSRRSTRSFSAAVSESASRPSTSSENYTTRLAINSGETNRFGVLDPEPEF